MGYGDEIMALGRAEAVYSILGKPVAIIGVSGNRRNHEVWENHPAVAVDSPLKILDGPQARPYMIRWLHPGPISVFNPKYRARAGRIKLTDAENATALKLTPPAPFAIVEPLVRGRSSRNKDWGFEKWAQVVKDFPIPVYQFDVDGHSKILPGVRKLQTPSFRISAGVFQYASLVMTIDGGTHHLAASMGVPAVVVFGGFANPKITGYPFHTNFFVGDPKYPVGCGRYDLCPHCKEAMNSIRPEEVRAACLEIVNKVMEAKKEACDGC